MKDLRTAREDKAARITRTIRDRAYRAAGCNSQDEVYQGIVWSLAQVRNELRSTSTV